MRLVTFTPNTAEATPRAGVRVGHRVLDIEAASRVDGEPLPRTMKELLRAGRGALSRTAALAKAAQVSAGRYSGAMYEERAVRFLPPVPDPDKFVCVENEADEVTGFAKGASSLVGQDAKVPKAPAVGHLDVESELVFVIGRRAEGVTADDDWTDYVVGVTVLNDLTARDMQSPMGPEIVTLDEIEDPYDLWMTCVVNGEQRTRINTNDQAWKIGDILEHFSRDSAIEPGDMFSTGTMGVTGTGRPDAKMRCLKAGDVVESSIEGVMTLRTTIVEP